MKPRESRILCNPDRPVTIRQARRFMQARYLVENGTWRRFSKGARYRQQANMVFVERSDASPMVAVACHIAERRLVGWRVR